MNRNSKSTYKSLIIQQLYPFINDNIPIPIPLPLPDTSTTRCVMHLWVDCPPSSKKKLYYKYGINNDYEYDVYEQRKSKREIKKKTSATTNTTAATTKKVHPRSHEHNMNHTTTHYKEGGGSSSTSKSYTNVNHEDKDLLLCTNYFYNGTCPSYHKSTKNSGSSKQCPFFHYDKMNYQHTLHDILSIKDTSKSNNLISNHEKILKRSSDAAVSAYAQQIIGTDLDNNSINDDDKQMQIQQLQLNQNFSSISMMYYLEIDLTKFYHDDTDNTSTTSYTERQSIKMSDIVSEVIATESCPISSIIYVAFNNTLIFDRYNGGIIIEKELIHHHFLSPKKVVDKRRMSLDFNNSEVESDDVDFTLLPVAVLEHVLTFLPDEASGVLLMVCKAWNADVGTTSPALWQYLLSRRKWPWIVFSEEENIEDLSELTATNNTTTSSSGKSEVVKELFVSHKIMCKTTDTVIKGIECLQSGNLGARPHNSLALHSFKESKESINEITTLRQWDDLSMISGCRKDCTLNIYKAVRNDESSIGLHCKQLLSIRVAPYPSSKRMKCELQSFALDDIHILCYYDVFNYPNGWLVLVKRDDLLLNSAESILDESAWKSYNISELYGDFLRSSESLDSVIGHMVEFEENIEFIRVSITGDIISCNDGNFVFILLIKHPVHLNVIAAIVQFSVRSESITFCQHFDIDLEIDEIDTIEFQNYLSPFDAKTNSIVYTRGVLEPIVTLHAERRLGITTLNEHHRHLSKCIKPYMIENGLRISSDKLFSLASLSHLIFAYVVKDDEEENPKVLLSFSHQEFDEDKDFMIVMDGLQEIISMEMYGDYVMMVCEGINIDHDHFDGQWFGFEETENQKMSYVSLVHIPTRTEIYRRPCIEKYCDLSNVKLVFGNHDLPLMLASKGKEGVSMSGEMLREIEVEIQHEKVSVSKPKVKKNKKKKYSNKKDAFARGMSLRG